MKDLIKIYEEAKEVEFKRRTGTGYVLTDSLTGKKYEQNGNFFLCGGIGIMWFCTTPMNRKLRKVLEAEGYSVGRRYNRGLSVSFGYENGKFEIGCEAIGKVVDYLNSFGYEVYPETVID